jgi:hypothetical protein
MKRIIFLFLLLNIPGIYGISQELIPFFFGFNPISFEQASDTQYILIDTNKVWFITKPHKELLILPSYLGEYALVTDTALYYPKNITALFQFKLLLNWYDYYEIGFWQAFNFEENKDGGIIETSYDDGLTWQNIIFDTLIMNHILTGVSLYSPDDTIAAFNNQPGFTGTQTNFGGYYVGWQNRSMINDTMLLRFTFASDSVDTPHEGWILDEFTFEGGLVPINDVNSDANVEFFPNPVNDILRIRSDKDPINSFRIYSLTGEMLLENTGININSILVRSMSKGFYLISCTGVSGAIYTFKFQKL